MPARDVSTSRLEAYPGDVRKRRMQGIMPFEVTLGSRHQQEDEGAREKFLPQQLKPFMLEAGYCFCCRLYIRLRRPGALSTACERFQGSCFESGPLSERGVWILDERGHLRTANRRTR